MKLNELNIEDDNLFIFKTMISCVIDIKSALSKNQKNTSDYKYYKIYIIGKIDDLTNDEIILTNRILDDSIKKLIIYCIESEVLLIICIDIYNDL